MKPRIYLFVLALAPAVGLLHTALANGKERCPVTKAPDPPFVPPPPYSGANLGSGVSFNPTGESLVGQSYRIFAKATTGSRNEIPG